VFDMIKVEITKLRKRKMTWILLAVMVAYYCLAFFGFYAVVQNLPHEMNPERAAALRGALTLPSATNIIFSTALGVGSLLFIILVASAVGSEYGWSTIRQVLTRKGIRHHYILAKLTAYLVYAIIGILLACITGFLFSMITTVLIDGSIDWSFITASFIGDMLRNYGWALYAVLPYILLAITFAVLGRSAMVGIGAGLGYYFIEQFAVLIFSMAGGTLAKIPHYLIGPNSEALLPQIPMAGPFAPSGDPPSTLWAAIAVAIYSIALLGVSLWLFKKRDITS